MAWFGRKKSLDRRTRFQNQAFSRRLEQAKRYQRQPRALPETGFDKVLAAIGLDTLWSRLAVAAALILLVYLVYIPNFLYIKNVEVRGVDQPAADSIHQAALDFFKASRAPLPQQNFLFFSPTKLTAYLEAHNQTVWKVNSVQKKPFSHIVISLQGKYERYSVDDGTGFIVLFNDGSISRHSDQAPPGLVQFKLNAAIPALPQNNLFFSDNLLRALELISDGFSRQIQSPITRIELPRSKALPVVVPPEPTPATTTDPLAQTPEPPPPAPEELTPEISLPLDPGELYVYTPKKSGKGDFRVIFDLRSDLGKALGQLKTLLAAMPPDRLAALAYVDMRLPDRAYVCLLGTACDK